MNRKNSKTGVPYYGTLDIFARYWKAYGGWKALFGSFYFFISLAITGLLYPLWMKSGWWETSIAILPNMIGFSLGGYAILLASGSDKFQTLLAKSKIENVNAFAELSATFAHFIIVQMLGLLLALVAKAHSGSSDTGMQDFPGHFILWGIGVFMLIYSILCGVAATMRTYRLSENFASHLLFEDKIAQRNRSENRGVKPDSEQHSSPDDPKA